jgi:hypothetical protein
VTFAGNLQDVTFEIKQTAGSNSLSFFVTILGIQSEIQFSSTTSAASEPLPSSLVPGTSVGLSVSFHPSGSPNYGLDFSSLTIQYGGASEVLLPANFLLQGTLTVKRSYLQPAVSVGSPIQQASPASVPCPDYSLGFLLLPPGFFGQSGQGSVPSSSRP